MYQSLFHIQKVSSSNLARDFRAHLAVCCDFRIVLIMSQSSLSPIEFASLRALLIKANHEGILDDLLSGLKSSMASGEVDSESSWDAIPGGTMSDASKRQLSPMGQSSAKSGKIGDSPQEVQIVTQDQWKQLESLSWEVACSGSFRAPVVEDHHFLWQDEVVWVELSGIGDEQGRLLYRLCQVDP